MTEELELQPESLRRATLSRLWCRIPVIVRSVFTGLLLAAAGTVPWGLLVYANIKHFKTLPWAAAPAVLYLWVFWRFAIGIGWPRSTAKTRRERCRANPLSAELWTRALIAGVLGIASIVVFQRLMTQIVRLPQEQDVDPTQFPVLTLLCWVVVGALVAGVVEETAFRGYMQGPIERRHGPVLAILVTGCVFAFAHFTHPEVGLILLPYYVAVAAVYGALAYLTNSILPSLALHTVGNILGELSLLTQSRSEWQSSSSTQPPLIWEAGPNPAFWIRLCVLLVLIAVTTVAYVALAKAAKRDSSQA